MVYHILLLVPSGCGTGAKAAESWLTYTMFPWRWFAAEHTHQVGLKLAQVGLKMAVDGHMLPQEDSMLTQVGPPMCTYFAQCVWDLCVESLPRLCQLGVHNT